MKKPSRHSQARLENLVESLLREEIALHEPRPQFRKKLLRRLQKERQPKNGRDVGVAAGIAAAIWWCKAPSVLASVALMATGAASVYLAPHFPTETIKHPVEHLEVAQKQSSARPARTLALVDTPAPVQERGRSTNDDIPQPVIRPVERSIPSTEVVDVDVDQDIVPTVPEQPASSAASEDTSLVGQELPVENPPQAASAQPTTPAITAPAVDPDPVPQTATETSAPAQSASSAKQEPALMAQPQQIVPAVSATEHSTSSLRILASPRAQTGASLQESSSSPAPAEEEKTQPENLEAPEEEETQPEDAVLEPENTPEIP